MKTFLALIDAGIMSEKTVLLDLEKNTPTVQLLRDIMQHYPTVYLFNCAGQFNFNLADVTEFSAWVSSGQVVILETPEAEHKEFEYAVVVGQLMALLEDDTHVEVISAMESSSILLKLLQSSDIRAHLIQVQPETTVTEHQNKVKVPDVATIKAKPSLSLVKQYCDALEKMTGRPNTVLKLRNSIANVLQVVPEKAQQLVGMLINLKIVKRYDEHIHFRKKVLKEWLNVNLDHPQTVATEVKDLDAAVAQLQPEQATAQQSTEPQSPIQHAQHALFKNFNQIDPVQVEVARKLRELKDNKPKDIYELRDLLENMFPKADIRMLLKELIEKGYIYWNGHEVLYSHEMFLN